MGLPFVLRFCEIHVETRPQGDLQLERAAPRAMHGVDFLLGVVCVGKIGPDGVVQHGDKGGDVAEGDIRGGLDAIGLVLLQARMPEGDLLLIVQPVLIVRTQASIQNPLLEPQIALSKVLGIGSPAGFASDAQDWEFSL